MAFNQVGYNWNSKFFSKSLLRTDSRGDSISWIKIILNAKQHQNQDSNSANCWVQVILLKPPKALSQFTWLPVQSGFILDFGFHLTFYYNFNKKMRPENNLEKCPLIPLLLHPLHGDLSLIPTRMYRYSREAGTWFCLLLKFIHREVVPLNCWF